MIGDGQEHTCSGCYEIIATYDPEAYQRGKYYYHSKGHENLHVSRNSNAFLKAEGQHSREVSREGRFDS
jgi:hypothetical protein